MKYAVTAATGNFGQTTVKTLSELTDKNNILNFKIWRLFCHGQKTYRQNVMNKQSP